MKAYQKYLAAVVCVLVFGVPAYGADVAKIGIVDFQKVLTESEAGKEVQAEIQKKGRKMESDLKELGEEIESLNKQLERDSMVMSKEKRQKKQRELEIKKYDFQSMQKKYQSQFREMENKLVGELQDEIFDIAETIGKREGYLLIIEKSAAVYYPSTIDITDQVIKAYNEKHDG